MDVTGTEDPNNHSSQGAPFDGDSAAGSRRNTGSREMVATLRDVKPSINDFDGRSKC